MEYLLLVLDAGDDEIHELSDNLGENWGIIRQWNEEPFELIIWGCFLLILTIWFIREMLKDNEDDGHGGYA